MVPTKTIIIKPGPERYIALAFSAVFMALTVALYQQNQTGWLMAFMIMLAVAFAVPALLSGNIILQDGRLTRTTWFGYTRQSIYVNDIEAFFELTGYSKLHGSVYILHLMLPTGKFVISSSEYAEYDKLKRLVTGRLSEATEIKRRYQWRQSQGIAFFIIACSCAIFCWLFLSPAYHSETAFLTVGFILLFLGFLMLPVNAYLYGSWNRKRK